MHPFHHILIIRLSAMGDVALTVPVIKSFKRQYPGVRVSVLTRPFFFPFFDGMDVDLPLIDLQGKHKGIIGLRRLSGELLNHNRFDAVLDLHDVLRSKIIRNFFKLSGVKIFSIQKGRREKKRFLNDVQRPAPVHTVSRYVQVFEKAGFAFDLQEEYITPAPTPLPAVITGLKGIKIALAPFAAHKSKEWGVENIIRFIALINAKYDVHFILFGGKDEATALEKIAARFDNVVNIAGSCDLRTELNILRQMHLLIGMDSGNAHLAALSGLPVISIWGGTHPLCGFAPLYQPAGNTIVPEYEILKNCRLSVYGSDRPQMKNPPYFCIQTIPPETVLRRVESLIKKIILST